VVSAAPVQSSIGVCPAFDHNGYRIQPMADFHAEALVLGTARYRFDRGADLSPVDLALGWGVMSDSSVLNRLSLSQDNRWVTYSWSGSAPASPRLIGMSCTNMHVIPADEDVRRAVLAVRRDDVVRLKGRLVSVSAVDGWVWKSSLYRSDTGGGACEVVWLESVERLDK
jgi:hypothetical protein